MISMGMRGGEVEMMDVERDWRLVRASPRLRVRKEVGSEHAIDQPLEDAEAMAKMPWVT